MAMKQYFGGQKENLRRSLNWEPFAEIFPLVDKLYVDAMGLMPSDRSSVFGPLLLICHKAFLSAAGLIGQAQPDDAGPITRRAIEAARFAAIIKTNPEKVEEWIAYNERMQRWADRQEGKKPKSLRVNLGQVHPGIRAAIDDLMQMLGIISDADVHFTPEYFHQLDWDKREESLYLNYFTRDQRVLEREIIFTSGAHLRILEVIDWCLDGAFKSNPDWLRLVGTLKEKGAPLAQKFERPNAEV
jgi:hypothetical protein